MKLCRNIDWTLTWRFRRKDLFHLCLSLAHLLTLCHIEATSRRKGSTRTDTPALQGYHHSPPPSSPLISSAFALWAKAELYILGPSLTFFLSFFLPLDTIIKIQGESNCLYVCQSVSWLTSLLKLDKCRDISCSGWDIFLKILETFLGCLYTISKKHQFLHVCQSVSLLTSFLKLDKHRDISCSGWDISPNFSGDIPEMFVHNFQVLTNFLYVCQSFSWLTSLLKLDKYRDISSPGWDIFLKFFGGFPGMFLH